MMVEVNNVKSFGLAFEIDGDDCSASITQWPNGAGWTVSFLEGVLASTFDVSDEMLDVIMNLHIYATTYKEPTDEMAE
jgi:hypothetical protein